MITPLIRRSISRKSNNSKQTTKMTIGSIAKFEELKYFCPSCKDDDDGVLSMSYYIMIVYY